ncbi:MAG: MGDG synthase family glycosyltransferase [Leptospirales bacterium]
MIALFHATTGQGHQKAAEAIHNALLLEGYPTPDPIDTLDLMTTPFRKIYRKGYLALAHRHPNLLDTLYNRTDHPPDNSLSYRLRLSLGRSQSPGFIKTLQSLSPSVIACTHFLPLELLSAYQSGTRPKIPIVAVLTDLYPHGFWIHPHVDRYIVPNQESVSELESQGVSPHKIQIAGIPINPAFSRNRSQAETRKQLGLPDCATILILSGGFGVGPLTKALQSFAHSSIPCSVIVVAGHNVALEKKLQTLSRGFSIPVTVRGFTRNMDELMDAADLVITKPGGLTTSEVLAKERPMILMSPHGGQERRNAEYLVKNGTALRVLDHTQIYELARDLLNDPSRRESMVQNCRRVSRPQAAILIAETLIGMDRKQGGY